ncbi:MAG: ABC transporter permease [Oscillospiraceae bacterium]|nr:ABC transporter permease [Oscillospiraceae bacterium]
MPKRPRLKEILLRWEVALLVLLALEIVVFGGINPKFLRPRVLFGSVNDFMSICVVSLMVTFVLVTGGMDIQSGAIMGLTSIVVGVVWNDLGVNIWLTCLLGTMVGALCGAISGFFVAYTGVQSMVVTLGGSFLYSGLALAVTKFSATESYKGISGFPKDFTQFAKGRVFDVIPNQLILFLVLIVLAYLLLHRTKYGRRVFLCGINRAAAEYCGINTRQVVMSTYILSGLSASLAGILLTAYLGTAKTDLGKELTLPIITAVVLGGTSNLGGSGGVLGTALAALVVGILRFGLSMAGLNTQYLDIPVGALLVLTVTVRFGLMNPRVSALLRRALGKKTAAERRGSA